MVCWFGVIINPLLYVLCNPAYRLNIADISDTNMSLITHHKLIYLLSWSGSIPSYSRASFYARFSYSGNLWQKAGHARSYFSDVIVFTQYNVFQVQISYYNEKRGMMLYFGQFLLEFLLVTSRSIESTTLTHSASSVSSGGENQHCALPMSICQFNQACNQLILI